MKHITKPITEPQPSSSLDNTNISNVRFNCIPYYCGKYITKKVRTKGIVVEKRIRIFCGKWDCKRCGKRKRELVKKNIIRYAGERGLNRFLTLTLDPSSIPPDMHPFIYLRSSWVKFRASLARKGFTPISYIWIAECSGSSICHLHVLISRFIPWETIIASWRAAGGGRDVYIKHVFSIEGLSEYLVTELDQIPAGVLPRGFRRVSSSRDIKLLQKRP